MSIRKHLASGDSLETAAQKELRKLGIQINASERAYDTMRTALREGFLEINDAAMNRVAKAFIELHEGDPFEKEMGQLLREYFNP